MERRETDWRAEPGAGVHMMGPAVSPRRTAGVGPALALAGPLPPFVRRRGPRPEAASEAAAIVEPPAAPEPEDEGVLAAPGLDAFAATPDDLGPARGADWEYAGDPDEGMAEFRDLSGEEPEAEPLAEDRRVPPISGEETAPAVEAAGGDPGGAAEPEEADLPEAAPAEEPGIPAPRMETALAEAIGAGEVPALQEVAGRLERIATALREGRPVELFSQGASDPLEVLIAGYALGYSEAFRKLGEERRGGR